VLSVQVHSETDAFLASSWSCRHWAMGLGGPVVRQHVPGHRTGDGERPTVERAATIGSPALETPVNCHSDLMEDPPITDAFDSFSDIHFWLKYELVIYLLSENNIIIWQSWMKQGQQFWSVTRPDSPSLCGYSTFLVSGFKSWFDHLPIVSML